MSPRFIYLPLSLNRLFSFSLGCTMHWMYQSYCSIWHRNSWKKYSFLSNYLEKKGISFIPTFAKTLGYFVWKLWLHTPFVATSSSKKKRRKKVFASTTDETNKTPPLSYWHYISIHSKDEYRLFIQFGLFSYRTPYLSALCMLLKQ